MESMLSKNDCEFLQQRKPVVALTQIEPTNLLKTGNFSQPNFGKSFQLSRPIKDSLKLRGATCRSTCAGHLRQIWQHVILLVEPI